MVSAMFTGFIGEKGVIFPGCCYHEFINSGYYNHNLGIAIRENQKSEVSIMCIWQEETASRSRMSAGSDCVSGDCCALGKDRTPFFGKTSF